MPRRYITRNKEEKLKNVKQGAIPHAWEAQGIRCEQVRQWVNTKQPLKPGNPLLRYERLKESTYEDSLQYQIELLN